MKTDILFDTWYLTLSGPPSAKIESARNGCVFAPSPGTKKKGVVIMAKWNKALRLGLFVVQRLVTSRPYHFCHVITSVDARKWQKSIKFSWSRIRRGAKLGSILARNCVNRTPFVFLFFEHLYYSISSPIRIKSIVSTSGREMPPAPHSHPDLRDRGNTFSCFHSSKIFIFACSRALLVPLFQRV